MPGLSIRTKLPSGTTTMPILSIRTKSTQVSIERSDRTPIRRTTLAKTVRKTDYKTIHTSIETHSAPGNVEHASSNDVQVANAPSTNTKGRYTAAFGEAAKQLPPQKKADSKLAVKKSSNITEPLLNLPLLELARHHLTMARAYMRNDHARAYHAEIARDTPAELMFTAEGGPVSSDSEGYYQLFLEAGGLYHSSTEDGTWPYPGPAGMDPGFGSSDEGPASSSDSGVAPWELQRMSEQCEPGSMSSMAPSHGTMGLGEYLEGPEEAEIFDESVY